MKRILCLGLILVCLFALGCNKQDDSTSDTNDNIEEYLPQYDMRQDYNGFYPMCEQDGVYYFKMNKFIHYYDSHTDQSGILCGRAECVHEDSTCNAWLGNNLGLCIYDNRLYWMGGLNGEMSLHSVNLQGLDRIRVQKIDEELAGDPRMDIHRGYVYVEVVRNDVRDGKTMHLVQITQEELGNADHSKVIFEKTYDYARIDCVFQGNHMYIMVSGKPQLEIYEYDIAEDKLERIFYQEKKADEYVELEHIRAVGDDLYIQFTKSQYNHVGGFDIIIKKIDLNTLECTDVAFYDFEDTPFCYLGESYSIIYSGTCEPTYYYITDYEGKRLYEGSMSVEYDKEMEDVTYEYAGGDLKNLLFIRDCLPKGGGYFRDIVIVDLEGEATRLIWSEREK